MARIFRANLFRNSWVPGLVEFILGPRIARTRGLARDTRPVQGLSASRRGGVYMRLVFFRAPRFLGGGLNTMPSSFMPSGSVK